MPSIIIRDARGQSRVLRSKPFQYEDILQRTIAEIPSVVPLETVTDESVSYLTIGVEWPAGTGSADIVLIGSDGVLTIIETKLRRNPEARRQVIAQLLEYAAYLSEWTIYEIHRRSEDFFRSEKCPIEYADKTFDGIIGTFLEDSGVEDDVISFKGKIEQNLRQGRMRLIVAVDEVGEQAQKIISFVNSHSSFDIYLLQISAFEDTEDRNIFVPALHGYARKISSPPDRQPWDWERYETDLGWSPQDVQSVKKLVQRLETISQVWNCETRFNQGWVTIYCYGKSVFGAQRTKQRGVELFFRLKTNPEKTLPQNVRARQTKDYLYLGGKTEKFDDDQLRRVCEASLRGVGLETSPHD